MAEEVVAVAAAEVAVEVEDTMDEAEEEDTVDEVAAAEVVVAEVVVAQAMKDPAFTCKFKALRSPRWFIFTV